MNKQHYFEIFQENKQKNEKVINITRKFKFVNDNNSNIQNFLNLNIINRSLRNKMDDYPICHI